MIKLYEAMNGENLHEICSAFKISLDNLEAGTPSTKRKHRSRNRPRSKKRPQPEPQPN